MDIKECLKKSYNINTVDIIEIPGRMFMLNYVVTDRTGNKYFVKTCPSDTTEVQLDIQWLIHEHLIKDSIPIPRIIRTVNNKSGLIFNNRVLCCFEYVQNDENSNFKFYSKEAGQLLGIIHKSLDKFDLTTLIEVKSDVTIKEIKNNLIYWLNTTKLSSLDNIDNSILEVKQDIIDFLIYFKEEKFEGLHKQLIHGDFNKNNVLTYKGNVNAVIDLFNLSYSYRITDLSESIIMYFGSDLLDNKWCLNIDKQYEFLSSYLEVNKLSNKEIENLPYMLKTQCIKHLANFTSNYEILKRLPEVKRVLLMLISFFKLADELAITQNLHVFRAN
ncbi:phosphotransferase enzyme family protein [Lysinibacillus sp. NPDC097231]|uniref:phosphotransferase enzyme family protein n=1 Tax=Lysinibacillus sp. NPDC097231 TaxID=3364142 RepID=UPI0037F94BAD